MEQEANLKFEWMELPEKQASRIRIKKFDFNLENINSWNDEFKWLLETVEIIKPIFAKYIKQWK